MKKLVLLMFCLGLLACSDDDTPDRVIYDITYTVTASNGATINKVQYLDSNANMVELENVSSPWTVSIRVRAGLGLEAAAFVDVPFGGSASINAVWIAEDGSSSNNETESIANSEPNTVINNGRIEIEGRTLPDP